MLPGLYILQVSSLCKAGLTQDKHYPKVEICCDGFLPILRSQDSLESLVAGTVQEWQGSQWAAVTRGHRTRESLSGLGLAALLWIPAPGGLRHANTCLRRYSGTAAAEVESSVLMDYLEEDVDPGKLMLSSSQGQVWGLNPWKKSFTGLRKKIAEKCLQQEQDRITEL